MSLGALAGAVLHGQPRAAARLISALEAGAELPEDAALRLWQAGGRARLIGLTGPPGVGKSTLANRLVADLRSEGQKVAVLAVDPSSPASGGAVLGDRVRMLAAGADPGVFIRSMSARGAFGGLSRAAGDALVVLDAMGFDSILVETVGVGQTEVEIAAFCPCVLLVQAASGGDAVQAIKAGIVEIGSAYVVTKPRQGDPAVMLRALSEAAALRHTADPDGWMPPALIADALTGEGMAALHAAIAARFRWLAENPARAAAEEDRRIHARALLALRAQAERRLAAPEAAGLAELVAEVRQRRVHPAALVRRLMGG